MKERMRSLVVVVSVAAIFSISTISIVTPETAAESGSETVKIWLTADHHVAREPGSSDPYEPYTGWGDALAQVEAKSSPAWDYDMCLCLGDLWNSGASTRTSEHLCAFSEGGYPELHPWFDSGNWSDFTEAGGDASEFLDQLRGNTSKDREVFYCTSGNHEPKASWSDWEDNIDPLGLNQGTSGVDNARRPFPIVASKASYGQETYEILVGENFRILMLGSYEGYPSYDYSDAYDWWVDRIEANASDNFITAAHCNFDDGMISLHWTSTNSASSDYNNYLSANADSHHNALWLGGHWHFYEESGICWNDGHAYARGNRTSFDPTYNCTNLNVAAICPRGEHGSSHVCPSMSYMLTLTNNSRTVEIATYNHSGDCWDEDNPDAPPHSPGNFTVTLSEPFVLSGEYSPPDASMSSSMDFGLELPVSYSSSGDTNSAPLISYNSPPSPSNGSTNVDLSAVFNFSISDPDGDNMTLSLWQGDPWPGEWTLWNETVNVSDGSYEFTRTLDDDTTYHIHGSVSDGELSQNADTIVFSTGGSLSNPPSADFTWAADGLTVTFTDNSSDSDGIIASYNWSFGDGESSTSSDPVHTYSSDGSYNVTLNVTDNDGAWNNTTKEIVVSEGGGGSTIDGGLLPWHYMALAGGGLAVLFPFAYIKYRGGKR